MSALLRLMTWLSPSFPVGAFSYSHGLEWAIEQGLVRDRSTLVDWVTGLLLDGTGRLDAAFLLEAHRAGHVGERLDKIAELADVMRGTKETALESQAQGTAFVNTVSNAWPDPVWDEWKARLKDQGRAPAYPVAVGLACARAGIDEADALAAYLHAFAANLVSAALRLVPLGQTDGQKAMAALEPVVLSAVNVALTRPLHDLGSASAVLDWCSFHHETQYTRLFRS